MCTTSHDLPLPWITGPWARVFLIFMTDIRIQPDQVFHSSSAKWGPKCPQGSAVSPASLENQAILESLNMGRTITDWRVGHKPKRISISEREGSSFDQNSPCCEKSSRISCRMIPTICWRSSRPFCQLEVRKDSRRYMRTHNFNAEIG